MQGLAAVTQLRDLALKVIDIEEGWVAGLLPLTSLTALTKLWCNGIRDTIRDDYRIFFLQEVNPGHLARNLLLVLAQHNMANYNIIDFASQSIMG
jgi:hypothetical protein